MLNEMANYRSTADYDDEIAAVSDALQHATGFQQLKLAARLRDAQDARENALQLMQLQDEATRPGFSADRQFVLGLLEQRAAGFDVTHTPFAVNQPYHRTPSAHDGAARSGAGPPAAGAGSTPRAAYGTPRPMPTAPDAWDERDPVGVPGPYPAGPYAPLAPAPLDREGGRRHLDVLESDAGMFPGRGQVLPGPAPSYPDLTRNSPGMRLQRSGPPPEPAGVLARRAAARIPWEMDEDEYVSYKQANVPDDLIWRVPGRRYG